MDLTSRALALLTYLTVAFTVAYLAWHLFNGPAITGYQDWTNVPAWMTEPEPEPEPVPNPGPRPASDRNQTDHGYGGGGYYFTGCPTEDSFGCYIAFAN